MLETQIGTRYTKWEIPLKISQYEECVAGIIGEK